MSLSGQSAWSEGIRTPPVLSCRLKPAWLMLGEMDKCYVPMNVSNIPVLSTKGIHRRTAVALPSVTSILQNQAQYHATLYPVVCWSLQVFSLTALIMWHVPINKIIKRKINKLKWREPWLISFSTSSSEQNPWLPRLGCHYLLSVQVS